jgi:NAD(P)H dehydrogenase (quinone)
VYYSATGNVHALARAVAQGAAGEGAQVRLRRVAELPHEMLISVKQYWGRHRSELEAQPEAQLDDIEWADGIAFGTPTRFGNVAAQLKMFIDLAGELWQQGKLVDKVATAFTSSLTEQSGQEAAILALNNTLYHWGAIVLPPGYTVHEAFNGGGNPYGTAYENTLRVACAQGARLTRVARAIRAAREAGLLRATATSTAHGGSPLHADERTPERRGPLPAVRQRQDQPQGDQLDGRSVSP